MTAVDRRPFTTAFINLLAAGTGRPVGDHEAPEVAAGVQLYPYVIVYSIGASFSGPEWWEPDSDGELVYQATSVGLTRNNADWMADTTRRTVLARAAGSFQVPITNPAGWVVAGRISSTEPEGPVPEGAPPNRLWTVVERFAIQVTPAT